MSGRTGTQLGNGHLWLEMIMEDFPRSTTTISNPANTRTRTHTQLAIQFELMPSLERLTGILYAVRPLLASLVLRRRRQDNSTDVIIMLAQIVIVDTNL